MLKVEKQFLQFCERYMNILAVLGISIVAVLIRLSLLDICSGDADTFLLEWYEQIKSAGGLKGLGEQTGNYNILYQTCIALLTYLPLPPLTVYKLFSVIFDYILAITVGSFVYHTSEGNNILRGIFAYSLVLLSPVVFFNSSMWAQCDSIYTAFVILSLVMMAKDSYMKSFLFLGIALSFKLQAIFVLPLYLFIWFYKKKFSILNFAVLPFVLWLSSIPGILAGRKILSAFLIYYQQSHEEGSISIMYPSFWVLFLQKEVSMYYYQLKPVAILLTVSILVLWMLYWFVKQIKLNTENIIGMALISVYTCVLFLPGMHERYGFVYEILALIYVFYNSRSIWLLILLNILSLATYGHYLCWYEEIDMMPYAITNVLVYCGYGCCVTGLPWFKDYKKTCQT